MPRGARLDTQGTLSYVMMRGIEQRAMAPGTRAATSWSGAASGTKKRILQALHPVKSLFARNGAAAGAIPTSSPFAVRSAHL